MSVSIASANPQTYDSTVLLPALLLFIATMPFVIVMLYVYYHFYLTSIKHRPNDLAGGEIANVVLLGAASIISYYISYKGTYDVLRSVKHNAFGPSETVAIISAVSGGTIAVSTGIAAIIKACALFLHARADVIRAQGEVETERDAIVVRRLALEEEARSPYKGRHSPFRAKKSKR